MQRPYRQIYFDCNATTPVLPFVADAAMETMRSLYGNPSSSHLTGLQAKAVLERARRAAARVLSAHPSEITFTSGATEAIQTAVFSALREIQKNQKAAGANQKPAVILCGATEHKAVPEALHYWVEALGVNAVVQKIPCDRDGRTDLNWLKKNMGAASLIATMAVNNETGVITPIQKIAELVSESKKKAGGATLLWLVDGVQALGKTSLPMDQLCVDYCTFSGHKLYAPKGIGFLYVREGAPFSPLMVGGGQESGHRSGTENLPGVAAFGRVLEALNDQRSVQGPNFRSEAELQAIRAKLVASLQEVFPKLVLNASFDFSVPTTINFSIPGMPSKEILDLFDSAGIRMSGGSACSSGAAKPSPVLEAMGLEAWRCESAVRLSFGPAIRDDELAEGLDAIREVGRALRTSCILLSSSDYTVPQHLVDGVIQIRDAASNTWVVIDSATRRAVIIDPLASASDRLEQLIQCQSLKIMAILDTHSHADHVSARGDLQTVLSSAFLRRAPQDELGWPSEKNHPQMSFFTLEGGLKLPGIKLSDAAGGTASNRVLVRLPTPGHTSDSCTYLLGRVDAAGNLGRDQVEFAFSGDLILSGGLGRTNFATSDATDMFKSLRTLDRCVGPQAVFCPSHDYNNSFGLNWLSERSENPLLLNALQSEAGPGLASFVAEKSRIDLDLKQREADFQGTVCGVTPKAISDADLSLHWDQIRERVTRGELKVIDIREPHEHAVFHDWKSIGLSVDPENVPLSRIVNFMQTRLQLSTPEALAQGKKPASVVLLCRSGSRSQHAARALRRMGIADVWNLSGGLAVGLPREAQKAV